MVEMTLNDTELMRYSRQILLEAWDVDAQLRLKASTVLVIGAGGLGCPVTQTLARAGVGVLHIVDDDVIELSNLPRQSLFFETDIGKSKAEVLAMRLLQHNPDVHTQAHIRRFDNHCLDLLILLRPDLILDCSDNFTARDTINALAMRANIPLLSAAATGEMGQLALFEQHTGCYHCVFGGGDVAFNEGCNNSGVLASTTAIIGNLQAQAALSYLGQRKNPIAGRLLLWCGKRFSLRQLKFGKCPNCLICN